MRAIRCYTAALLGIDPDLPLALINRGSLLEGQGQRAAAMADFKRVTEAQAKLCCRPRHPTVMPCACGVPQATEQSSCMRLWATCRAR